MMLIYSLHQDYIHSGLEMKQDMANPIMHFLIYAGLVGLKFAIMEEIED